jgi:hypothetical protein
MDMTPLKNQQTVEALKAAIEHWVREQVNPLSTPKSRWDARNAGRAALRDLVAQAELAREALGEIEHKATTRRTGVLMDGTETWAVPLAGEVAAIARDALARLDGAS